MGGCSDLLVPLASIVPGRINQGRPRPLRGTVVRFDPEGLLSDGDGEPSGQLQPASALQTVRPGLDRTAGRTEAEMSSRTRCAGLSALRLRAAVVQQRRSL